MNSSQKRFSEIILDDIALQLHDAVKQKTTLAPISETYGIDYAAAVEIRRRMANLLARYAGQPAGFKLAFMSPGMQEATGIFQPEFGYLFSEFVIKPGVPIEAASLSGPHVEPEVAFVMGRELEGPGIGIADVMEATERIHPAIEIVGSRIDLRRAKAADMVADNVLFGRMMLSDSSFAPDEFDLTDIPVSMTVDGDTETSNTSSVGGNPAASVAWLANRLAESNGREGSIEAGHIILTGSCTRLMPVKAGSVVDADFGPMGALHVDII
ncbi:MAG: fumarylacetoacetate hydrolase family protein [Rhodobacteraceae bacterium]|nr:fumarylacetoacetate hydrolase family protein [Paracoccaceae bacterium]MCY4197003.1 fumarylacetoacetate hydrolase family protein [Paracoccaceae bacterium]